MDKNNFQFSIIFLTLLLVSCQSYRYIEIETFNPAVITFPPEIRTVMIVNNSAQQPDHIGHKYLELLDMSDVDSVLNVSVDSMAYRFCLFLGQAIAESPLFDDVRICEDTLRHDSLFYMSQPFSVQTVEALCDMYDVDALITLDKLYYRTAFYNYYANTMRMITAEIIGEMRMVYPGFQMAYVIPFVDTLILSTDEYYYMVNETFTIQDIQDAILVLTEHTAQKMQNNFAPYWTDDKRWYYTNVSSGWKRASVFAAAEKWEAAANEWRHLLTITSKWKQKAMLASNLALFHEIQGDFTRAIEYATLANTLFMEHTGEEDRLNVMQNKYLELLQKREEDDKTLSEQLGENSNVQFSPQD